MEQILINNQVVHRHPLWTVLCGSFQELVRADSNNIHCFDSLPNIDCLALDKYNSTFNISNGGKTGDSALGISCRGKQGGLVSDEILFVELRLRYNNGRNISFTELKGKVDNSISILGRTIPIHPMCYFVFKDNVAPVAKSYLQRKIGASKNRASAKAFQIVGNSEFRNNISIICPNK